MRRFRSSLWNGQESNWPWQSEQGVGLDQTDSVTGNRSSSGSVSRKGFNSGSWMFTKFTKKQPPPETDLELLGGRREDKEAGLLQAVLPTSLPLPFMVPEHPSFLPCVSWCWNNRAQGTFFLTCLGESSLPIGAPSILSRAFKLFWLFYCPTPSGADQQLCYVTDSKDSRIDVLHAMMSEKMSHQKASWLHIWSHLQDGLSWGCHSKHEPGVSSGWWA
jgi:hypothetical protein